MKNFRFVLFLTVVILFVLPFSGCGDSTDKKLEDVKWTLESYGEKDNPQPVLDGTEVTATFNSEDSQVTGRAGCNSYFGDYDLTDGISIGMLGNTEMYCMEPEGIMDQEQNYLQILGQARDYSVDNETLTIDCGDNVLIYTLAANK